MKPLIALLTACFLNFAHAEPVHLVFAGDLMLDDGPGKMIAEGRDPLASFARALR